MQTSTVSHDQVTPDGLPLELVAKFTGRDGKRSHEILFDLLKDNKTWIAADAVQPTQIRKAFIIDAENAVFRIGPSGLSEAEKTLCILKGVELWGI